ncbi:MAG: hypothetical protein ACXAEU_15465 [Candidatus Hodarchaeales archaeon]
MNTRKKLATELKTINNGGRTGPTYETLLPKNFRLGMENHNNTTR